MDMPEFPTDKPSPRREIQGPRPTPLKVRKDSYMIKKPPLVPQPSQPPLQRPVQRPAQNRQPVVIYTISPKVIHADTSNFMTLVQRLTGSSSSSSSSSSSLNVDSSGAISPAARFAAIEKTSPSQGDKSRSSISGLEFMDGVDMGTSVELTGLIPGILSPLPSLLPPISPSFFSPWPDQKSMSFLHDLSPIFNDTKNYIEGTFVPSPTGLFSSPIISPTITFDLFNQFLDF